jgi:hypothetical protein
VYEEDTYLALSADPEYRPPTEHPVHVLMEAGAAQPDIPGTVVIQSGRPLRLLAIVHKLDEDPTWREEWVAGALESVFVQVERRDIHSISLPLLGTVHGKLEVERSLVLLVEKLQNAQPTPLDHIWLESGKYTPEEILSLLSRNI